jgi:DNA-binding transcriptional LysR family regulator
MGLARAAKEPVQPVTAKRTRAWGWSRKHSMQQLPDFEAWAIFAKVADCGSFSDAAKELGLTKATVSRAVSRLEARLRTTLLTRTTRKLSLTEGGRAALGRAARILDDGAVLEAEILEEAVIPRGPIRLACSAAFGRSSSPFIPRSNSIFISPTIPST